MYTLYIVAQNTTISPASTGETAVRLEKNYRIIHPDNLRLSDTSFIPLTPTWAGFLGILTMTLICVNGWILLAFLD